MNEMVMDVAADDNESMTKALHAKKWDARRKKFITVRDMDKKRLRNESGALIKSDVKKTDL